MSIETEQSRIDFEAHVASVIGSPVAMISLHWTGERYADASDLEGYWRCWTAAQQAASRHIGNPIAWAIFSNGHIEEHTTCRVRAAYWREAGHDVTQLFSFPVKQDAAQRRAGIDELVKVLNPYVGSCLTISQSAEALYDAGYRKQVAP